MFGHCTVNMPGEYTKGSPVLLPGELVVRLFKPRSAGQNIPLVHYFCDIPPHPRNSVSLVASRTVRPAMNRWLCTGIVHHGAQDKKRGWFDDVYLVVSLPRFLPAYANSSEE